MLPRIETFRSTHIYRRTHDDCSTVPSFTYRNTHGNPSSLSHVPPTVFFFVLRNNISGESINAACFSLIANNNLPPQVSKFSCFDHGLCGLRGRFKLTSKFTNSVGVSPTINRPRSGKCFRLMISSTCVVRKGERAVHYNERYKSIIRADKVFHQGVSISV